MPREAKQLTHYANVSKLTSNLKAIIRRRPTLRVHVHLTVPRQRQQFANHTDMPIQTGNMEGKLKPFRRPCVYIHLTMPA